MLISEAFNEYMGGYLSDKGAAPGTFTKYRVARDLFLKYIGDLRLSKINEDHIKVFREKLADDGERKRCSNTVFFNLSALRSVLRFWSVRGEKCMRYELIILPKFERNIQPVIYEEEVRDAIEAADTIRDKFVISLLFSCGLRISELVSLDKWQIRDGQLAVKGKGGKIRPLFLDKRTIMLMDQYLETRDDRCDALIVSQYNKRISKGTVAGIVKKTTQKAGITKNVHPHTYRHGFATNFLLNGGNIWDLRLMMGHSDISTTVRYTHITDPTLKKSYNKNHTF